jgi:deazaflavin-dependent oxidoreductase (nitroreductase family)
VSHGHRVKELIRQVASTGFARGLRSVSVSSDAINGVPRVDPRNPARAAWKRAILRTVATRPGAAIHRIIAAPLDAPIMRATGGRVSLAVGAMPLVVLKSTGARSGQPRETPLGYFTDGDDVILIASSYGRERHPGWYHNLLANPECELHIGPRGGRFVARQAEGADRDRLFGLAVDHYLGYANYAKRTDGTRTIPVLRLTPVPSPG